ncbi:MAG: POTRA domain-containing protein [Rikenellaceae bacterium]
MRLIFLLFLFAPIYLYSQQNFCISNIYITGNTTTKAHVILRELPFKQGDTISNDKLEGILKFAKNNLLNLSLFNFVYITKSKDNANPENIDIKIDVEERWYIWPVISFKLEDRNLSNWIKEADWNRITIDTGFRIYNAWGLDHRISVVYRFGYEKGFYIEYQNIAIGQTGKHILGFGAYGQFSKTENFITLFNSPIYNRSDNEFVVKTISAKISYTYRPRIRINHSLVFQYENTHISDTILKLNPQYWGTQDTVRNGVSLSYIYTSDQRDNIQYPMEGYCIEGELRGYTNFDYTMRYGQIRTNLQYYLPLSNRWNISATLAAGVSKKNKKAFIFDRAIGYEDVILRGYEYYVNDGQHYVIFNPTLKFNILPTKVAVINFLSFLPKFNKIHFTMYGKAFFDMGYSYHSYPQYSNFLSNKFLCSGGFGLDIISYYDLHFSIDYSFNQLKEHGFFFTIRTSMF